MDAALILAPGEEPLNATNEQLIKLRSKVDHRKAYNADSAIRFNSFLDLEVLLLETSGPFKNKDERKISFHNINDLYALLFGIMYNNINMDWTQNHFLL